MDTNPYRLLSKNKFWRPSVAEKDPLDFSGIYKKKFTLSLDDKVATAGSCFAQHLTRAMKQNGFSILDVEPPPRMLERKYHSDYGFNLYSARYSNIYTVRQLLFLVKEAFGLLENPDPVWTKNGRYYDSMRPAVDPNGLESPNEVKLLRTIHLKKVKQMLQEMDVFIFTLGLTETWEYKNSGWVFPTVPGSIAGTFDNKIYSFVNFDYNKIYSDLKELFNILEKHNNSSNLRYIFTVSPVPLTATYSTEHILSANTYSKSILRSIAGYLSETHSNIDYFPSYEIISNTWSRGIFYEQNCRSVRDSGVNIVMNVFFSEHNHISKNTTNKNTKHQNYTIEETNCEEVLLDIFSGNK